MNIKQLVRTAGESVNRNSPEILTGIGVAGVVSTVALAIKGTVLAIEVIDDKEFYVKRKLETKEIIELVWKLYLPTAASGAITIASIIGSNRISSNRQAGLASLFAVADKSLKEYQDKVAEMFGEKKEAKVRDELAQDKLDESPVRDIIITGKGEYLFFDALSGRYFRSDMEKVRKAQNDFNELLFNDMYVPLNELYDMLGLEGTEMGTNTGWDVQNGKLDIHFSAKIAQDGEPCVVLGYSIQPRFL